VFGTLFHDRRRVLRGQHAEGVEGGWVPLALGGCLMALMTSWKRGRRSAAGALAAGQPAAGSFLARLPQSRTIRVPGMAVFLTGNPDYVPTALLHNLKHNKVLHEKVLFVTVQNHDDRPRSRPDRAHRGRGTGAGHPSRHAALRLHGKPEHPARAGGSDARPSRSTRCRSATSLGAR
jgi:KUP system potassium uptake protein